MSKLEGDTLKLLAKKHSTGNRSKVVLPDLPKLNLLAEDQEQAWKHALDEWDWQVIERKVDALYEIAKERNADVKELAKVADMILEVVPPKFTGKKGKDRPSVLMLVALEIHKGKSQKVACELAGVTAKTFRKYTEIEPAGWELAQHLVAKLPEKIIREIVKE